MRAVLAVALVLLASAPALAADKPVPKYDGKPLEYWVERFQKAENEKDRDTAARALAAFGPDAAPALPTFIEMLADHSPTYRDQVIDIVAAIGPKAREARPIISKLVEDKKTFPSRGIDAIVAISAEPKDAVPVLIPLVDVPVTDGWAYSALCDIGPDAKTALPAIRRYVLKELAAKEKDDENRLYGLDKLSKLGPDVVPLLVEMLDAHGGYGRGDAFLCLHELGPKALKAAPVLLKLLKHDDAAVRVRAAIVLWKVEKHTAVITTLAELAGVDPDIRYWPVGSQKDTSGIAADAVRFLGGIGPDARAALPQLREVAAVGLTFWFLTRGGNSPYLHRNEGGSITVLVPYDRSDEQYKLWRTVEARITTGQAALEAIAKIEGKTKK